MCLTGERARVEMAKIPAQFTGTGDLFAALLLAWGQETLQVSKCTTPFFFFFFFFYSPSSVVGVCVYVWGGGVGVSVYICGVCVGSLFYFFVLYRLLVRRQCRQCILCCKEH